MNQSMTRPLAALCVLLLAGAALLVASCGPEEQQLPVQVTPWEHDFGRVLHGEERLVEFTIANNSDRAVTIASAKPNCSCFEYIPPRDSRLDPGDKTVVKLRLVSAAVPPQRFRGKALDITTDHPGMQRIRIPLEGVTFSPTVLEIENSYDKLYFQRLGDDASLTPRKLFIRHEPGFEVALDKSMQRFAEGYAFEPKALADVFEVEVTESSTGHDVAVKLRKGAKRTSKGHQLNGSLTFAMRVKGPELAERTIFGTVKLHGTWPQ